MYAIVEIVGQQFKVTPGQELYVHHLGAESGASVSFNKVLLVEREGAVTVGTPTVKATVTATVVTPLVKGDKVLIFQKKRRKGYQKMNGHRQQFTRIKIESIA